MVDILIPAAKKKMEMFFKEGAFQGCEGPAIKRIRRPSVPLYPLDMTSDLSYVMSHMTSGSRSVNHALYHKKHESEIPDMNFLRGG